MNGCPQDHQVVPTAFDCSCQCRKQLKVRKHTAMEEEGFQQGMHSTWTYEGKPTSLQNRWELQLTNKKQCASREIKQIKSINNARRRTLLSKNILQ